MGHFEKSNDALDYGMHCVCKSWDNPMWAAQICGYQGKTQVKKRAGATTRMFQLQKWRI